MPGAHLLTRRSRHRHCLASISCLDSTRHVRLPQNRSISVPYLTSFHLTTKAALHAHKEWANASSRKALAVMYAGVHGAGPDGIELRRSLSIVCEDSDLCTHVKFGTGLSNAEVHAELRAATFCLEPQGDTPFRSQVFECLVRCSPPGTVGANPASPWP